jgi:hypothetical protein
MDERKTIDELKKEIEDVEKIDQSEPSCCDGECENCLDPEFWI